MVERETLIEVKLQKKEKKGTSSLDAQELTIYPNPVGSRCLLLIHSSLISSKAYLCNIKGEGIKTIILNQSKVELSLIDLPKGLYFLTTERGLSIPIIHQ